MRIRGEKHREIHSFFDTLTARAYRWTWLAANPVLARSPHTSYIRRYLTFEPNAHNPKPSFFRVIISYFLNNGKSLRDFFRQRHILKAEHCFNIPDREHLICVDSVLYMHSALEAGRIELQNLSGLEKELASSGRPWCLLPILYGDLQEPLLRRLAKLATQSDTPVLFAHQLMTRWDLVRACFFLVGYPLALLLFTVFHVRAGGKAEMLFREEALNTLGQATITTYLRFLLGRRLGLMSESGLTLLSWCENRAADKLLYKGVRTTRPEAEIVGIQTFIFPDNYIGCYINEAERDLGFAPDRLVVNGPYYLPDPPVVEARVGPSLRYAHLFEHAPEEFTGSDVLILLSYNDEATRKLLDLISEIEGLQEHTLRVRAHPAKPLCTDNLPDTPQLVLSQRPLIDDLLQAGVVIGTETGTMLEAVACGVPLIDVDTMGSLSLADMPPTGKGLLWFKARSAEDISRMLPVAAEVPAETRWSMAKEIRRLYFNAPQPGGLLRSMGITVPSTQATETQRHD